MSQTIQKMAAAFSAVDWNARLPVLANTVLVLLLAYTLAGITWRLVPQPLEPLPPVAELPPVAAGSAAAPSTDFGRQIASWHLFGRAESNKPVAAPAPPRAQAAPDTRLRLTLKGVFVSDRPGEAWAIIADHRGKEDTYRPGSNLPGGASLLEVYPDRVILLHNRRRETLRLPDANQEHKRGRAGRSSPRREAARLASGPVTTVTGEAAQVLRDYRQKLLTDPQSVMSAVRAEPFREGGKLMGYRIFPGADRQLLQKIGLRPGDVVTAINGIRLDSPLKGLEVMQNISNASEVSVEVLRDGFSQTFVVSVNH